MGFDSLAGSLGLIILASDYCSVPCTNWSARFWAKVDYDTDELVKMYHPVVTIVWTGTTLTTVFAGTALPVINTATTMVQKWFHVLFGSSTSEGYLAVTFREPGQSFHTILPAIVNDHLIEMLTKRPAHTSVMIN